MQSAGLLPCGVEEGGGEGVVDIYGTTVCFPDGVGWQAAFDKEGLSPLRNCIGSQRKCL